MNILQNKIIVLFFWPPMFLRDGTTMLPLPTVAGKWGYKTFRWMHIWLPPSSPYPNPYYVAVCTTTMLCSRWGINRYIAIASDAGAQCDRAVFT